MRKELLFDTNCLIDIYRGRERISPFFQAILEQELIPYISVITEAELWRGLRVGELEKHELLLTHFAILPLRSEASRLAGSWMSIYRPQGLGWMDALITATAKTINIPILTRDKRLAAVLNNEAIFSLYD